MVVGVGLSLAAVTNRGLQYRSAYRAAGLEVPASAIIRTTASGYAANKVVRVAGASGLAVFLVDGRRRGFASSAVMTGCAIASVGSFVALGTLLMSSAMLMALTGELSAWWTAALGAFLLEAVVLGLLLRSVITDGRVARRAEAVAVGAVDRWQRRRTRVDGPRVMPSRPRAWSVVDQAGRAYERCRVNPVPAGRVLAHALMSKALGAAMLATAVQAFDLRLGLGTVVVLYATALAASFVSILPGGVGMVEASMTALLVSHGVPASAAALAVLLFRLFDLGLPVAVGLMVASPAFGPSASATADEVAPAVRAVRSDQHSDEAIAA